MNFNHSEYQSNAQNRIEHLREIIAGRPVAILAAGPSIAELEKRINELAQADICYFGMNVYFIHENHILKKINKRFSVVFKGGDEGLPPILDGIINFLDRDDNNLLVSTFYKSRFDLLGPDFNLQKFLDKYNEKLLFPGGDTDRTVPDNDRPLHFLPGNALSWLIYLAVIGKASKIILFGADGYTENKDIKKTYYRSEEYGVEPQQQLINNTNKGFNPIVPISLRNIYKTHRLKPIPILNCSEVSFYTPFPKVSYDDGFAFLLGKKNTKEISDLRTPTASIIIPSSGNETELQDTLKNIAKQSYSNYECVVIQRKSDSDFLDTIKNALSLARGKYVFYCPSGYGYQDRDWINSCLEILENRPQISLVCGLPQNTELPWPKKKFIYYWLKKEIFFPANTLCVRKKILGKCLFQIDNISAKTELESWLNFNLRFNITGYLPAFIPTTAGYHRYKDTDQKSNKLKKDGESLRAYRRKINNYKHRLVFKKTSHHFRDGDDNILPGKFYLSVFLLYELAKKIKAKLPRSLHSYLNIIRRIVRECYQK